MAKRQWWQRPRLRRDEELQLNRSVTWLELFFDLVFVVVISRLAHNFSQDISINNFLVFSFMFIPVFWVWNGNTYYAERFESEGLEIRIFTLVSIIPVAGMAIFSHHGLEENYAGFALSYLAARSINIMLWFRTLFHVPEFRPTAFRFIFVFLAAAILIIVSLFLPGLPRLILWSAAILVDVISPAFTMKPQKKLPQISTSKFPERFGLFTIIVLGEALVGVINGLSDFTHLTVSIALYGILGLFIGFSLWWVYFDFIARRPPAPNPTITLCWVYLHILLTLAVTLTGVCIAEVLKGVFDQHAAARPAQWLCSAISFALVVTGLLESTLKRTDTVPAHPVFSPLLKTATGLLLGCLTVFLPLTPLTALLLSVGALFIQQLYGVIVWFSQELPAGETGRAASPLPQAVQEEVISFEEED